MSFYTMKITDLDTDDLRLIINALANGSLTEDAIYELAEFLCDAFCDGIDMDRLRAIVDNTTEFANLDELADNYMSKEEIAEFKKECEENEENYEQALKEQIMESYCCTVLTTSDGFITIE